MHAGALSRYQAGKVAAEYVATDPHRFGRLAGWHTAGINVAGSLLLGGISALPTRGVPPAVDVARLNSKPRVFPTTSTATTNTWWKQFEGISPRTRLMMGVGYVSYWIDWMGRRRLLPWGTMRF
jgi:hypothetical protein